MLTLVSIPTITTILQSNSHFNYSLQISYLSLLSSITAAIITTIITVIIITIIFLLLSRNPSIFSE